MSIRFLKDKKQFVINTKNTTYIMEILKDKYLCHVYYGKRANNKSLPEICEIAFSPYDAELGKGFSTNEIPQEISFFGSGDFRGHALRINGADGTGVTDFVYKSHRIFSGRKELDGLPCARADETHSI